jgi:tRNA 2-(methylsulfanyl)-N6-isopentenyladenosine37 hydroxylase
LNILAAPTSQAWVESACAHWRSLLLDHANCEKKAASSALSLMFAYPDDAALCLAVSRLAREELRHFEQVAKLMHALQVPFERQKPSRYGAGLRAALRAHEPARKLDLLLSSALIEARSCERFALLAPRLAEPLGSFYGQLQRCEARHFELYLRLARAADADGLWQQRLQQLAAVEAELITAPDPMLRFHSGPLAPPLPAATLQA